MRNTQATVLIIVGSLAFGILMALRLHVPTLAVRAATAAIAGAILSVFIIGARSSRKKRD